MSALDIVTFIVGGKKLDGDGTLDLLRILEINDKGSVDLSSTIVNTDY